VGDPFQSTKALVEAAIQTLGVSPEAARAKDGEGHASWTLQRGSAAILIALATRETGPGQTGVFLRVISPVMTLPDASKREALFKHLLELNAQGLANAAFGLVNERVVAVSERPADDLQSEEVGQMVRHLAAVADTYDNRLVNAFGGKLASDKKT
jgi:Putative bacterial sensory transduction regulator